MQFSDSLKKQDTSCWVSENMVKAGWRKSLLENDFFTLRRDGELGAMAVTHVDGMLLTRDRSLEIKKLGAWTVSPMDRALWKFQISWS